MPASRRRRPVVHSGFYSHAVVAACGALDVRFSVTIRQQPAVRRLVAAIPEAQWTPIPYWLEGGADVAETAYTPFRHSGAPRRRRACDLHNAAARRRCARYHRLPPPEPQR